MKFNPTLPLALALSVGVAGAVMAQTAATQTPSAPATQPAMNYGQPQANAGQTPAATTQAPASTNQAQARTGQMPPATPQAQQAPSANSAPTMASRTAVNGNEQVRMAQQRLRAAGLYNGPEDGIMDPDTRAALARYQEQNGLQRSEALDPATLAKLEGSQSAGSGSTAPPASMTSPGMPSPAPSPTANPYAGAVGGNSGKSGTR